MNASTPSRASPRPDNARDTVSWIWWGRHRLIPVSLGMAIELGSKDGRDREVVEWALARASRVCRPAGSVVLGQERRQQNTRIGRNRPA